MFDERRIIAAVAVMLFAYALVALLAFSARGTPASLYRQALWQIHRGAPDIPGEIPNNALTAHFLGS